MKNTILITNDQLGVSEKEPGQKLMKSFLATLSQSGNPPETILLVNTGVKLAVKGADILEDLETLAEQGTEILLCGTCVGYYELTDRIAVGRVTNMVEIVEKLNSATQTITL